MSLLDNFIKERYDTALDNAAVGEKLRDAFVKDYPIDSIINMTMDDYLFAKKGYGNPKSFCRRLRYDLQILASMGNVYPNVFGIYLRNGVELTLSKTFEQLYNDDRTMAFTRIKQEITDLLEGVEKDDYSVVEKSILNSSFKYKLLLVYFPEKIFPVCGMNTAEGYLRAAGISVGGEPNLLSYGEALISHKNSDPVMKDWSNHVYMNYLDYVWRMNEGLDVPNRDRDYPGDREPRRRRENNQIEIQKEKANELKAKLDDAYDLLDSLNDAKESLCDALKPGTEINHRKFGEGKIKEIDNNKMIVSFSDKDDKILGIIECASNGTISFKDNELQSKLEMDRDILRRDDPIRKAVERAEQELIPYMAYLD